jgi:hypothetical protein
VAVRPPAIPNRLAHEETTMTPNSAALFAFGWVLQGAAILPDGGRVTLDLVPDRTVYHVGEAVRLTLTVRNVGAAPVFGYMRLKPYLPSGLKSSLLLYCRDREPCLEFLGKIPNVDKMNLAVTPNTLAAGARERSDFVVALNPANRHPVLEAPGEYEFRWVTWGIHERDAVSTRVRGRELSASAFIRVLPVPNAEHRAFAYYVENALGELAQFDPAYAEDQPGLRLAARTMLERYPDSIYAAAIRRGILELLELRALHGRVTPEEQELLAELRARRAQP